jgi:hypothetical protein
MKLLMRSVWGLIFLSFGVPWLNAGSDFFSDATLEDPTKILAMLKSNAVRFNTPHPKYGQAFPAVLNCVVACAKNGGNDKAQAYKDCIAFLISCGADLTLVGKGAYAIYTGGATHPLASIVMCKEPFATDMLQAALNAAHRDVDTDAKFVYSGQMPELLSAKEYLFRTYVGCCRHVQTLIVQDCPPIKEIEGIEAMLPILAERIKILETYERKKRARMCIGYALRDTKKQYDVVILCADRRNAATF